jgi:GNAT superfamily N-acetyltransferase
MTIAAPKLDINRLRIVPLPSSDAFRDFRSGESEIDHHLDRCWPWHDCHRSRVFCAYLEGEAQLYGFYCLGLHAHESKYVDGVFARAADDTRNYVPFIYINYFAVRDGWRHQKIGTVLLMNALERCAIVIRNIGAYGVALSALTDDAAAFYDHYGFRTKDPNQRYPFMVLPAQSVLDLVPP